MRTILRYAGGKSRAYKYITPYIEDETKIISPFIGGGSLETRWSTELGINIQGYDIFEPLVNFWNVLINQTDDLYSTLSGFNADKETYDEIKELLLSWDVTQKLFEGYKTNYYNRTSIELDNVTAAAYYFFNHNLSYGPMFLGWMSKNYITGDKWYNMLERLRKFKAPNLKVSLSSFEDVISSHPNDTLYLDPPYYLEKDGDNKMFKGIYPNPNFDMNHTGFDHELLRDLLNNHKGNFILSYNNCQTVRSYYSDFKQVFPSWTYSYGSGETRIGKNKTDNKPKESHEILIVKKNDVTASFF